MCAVIKLSQVILYPTVIMIYKDRYRQRERNQSPLKILYFYYKTVRIPTFLTFLHYPIFQSLLIIVFTDQHNKVCNEAWSLNLVSTKSSGIGKNILFIEPWTNVFSKCILIFEDICHSIRLISVPNSELSKLRRRKRCGQKHSDVNEDRNNGSKQSWQWAEKSGLTLTFKHVTWKSSTHWGQPLHIVWYW